MPPTALTIGLDQAAPIPLHTAYTSALFEGFEVDLMQILADNLNIRVAYTVAPWNELLQKLENQTIDAVCSAVTITQERQEYLHFSEPYLDFHLGIVCRKDHRLLANQLHEHPVGVRQDTTAEHYLVRAMHITPGRRSNSNEELYSLLLDGQLHAVIDDSPIAHGFVSMYPELIMVGVLPGSAAQYGIAFKKGDGVFLGKVNEVLNRCKQSGQLKALQQKWFGSALL